MARRSATNGHHVHLPASSYINRLDGLPLGLKTRKGRSVCLGFTSSVKSEPRGSRSIHIGMARHGSWLGVRRRTWVNCVEASDCH